MTTPITTDASPTVRARLPRPLLGALDEVARETGTSRSDALREMLRIALTERGYWPPRRVSRP